MNSYEHEIQKYKKRKPRSPRECFVDPNPTRVDLVPVEVTSAYPPARALVRRTKAVARKSRALRPRGSTQDLDHARHNKRVALQLRLWRGFCDPAFNVPLALLLGYLTTWGLL